jgi:hypothetical protein
VAVADSEPRTDPSADTGSPDPGTADTGTADTAGSDTGTADTDGSGSAETATADRDTTTSRSAERSGAGNAQSPSSTVPKLSIGHRILAALPQLRREPAVKPSERAEGTGSTSRPSTGGKNPRASSAGSGTRARPRDADTEAGGKPDGGGDADPAVTTSSTRGGFLKPAPADGRPHPDQDKSPAELVHMIKTIDDRELRLARLSVPLGIILGVVITIAAIHSHPKSLTGVIIVEGVVPVVFALLLLVALRTRRRSFVAFSLIFMGLPVLPYGVVFAGLGIWMILRSYKWQRILTTKGGDPNRRSATASRSGRASGTGGRSANIKDARARGTAAAAERRRRRREPEVKGPSASKRYTPPKPPRPPPPNPTE